MTFKKFSAIWWILCLGLLLPLTTVVADDDEEEDDQPVSAEEWKKNREDLKKLAMDKLNQWLAENVTRQIVVNKEFAKYWMTWNPQARKFNIPLKPAWTWSEKAPNMLTPKLTPEQVKETLEKKLEEAYRKENPEPSRDELMRLGRKKYKMFEIDTPVSFKIREGKGTNTIVSGKYKSLNNEYIVIGQRFIHRQDLDDETLALFYEDKNDELVENFVNAELRKYNAKLENYIYNHCQDELPAALLKEGYVPKPRSRVPGTPGYEEKPQILFFINPVTKDYIGKNSELSPNIKLWESRQDAVERRYRIKYELAVKTLTPKYEKEVFEDPELDPPWVKDDGEWVPKTVAEERRAAKEAEAQQKQEGQEQP